MGDVRAHPGVGMVVFSHYPDDPRVRREAEALARSGYAVDVVCLRKRGQSAVETINGVRALRVPVARQRGSPLRYIWEYAAFTLLAMAKLGREHLRRRYRVVHVHNMPDILVASALVPRLGGARLVLDLHDPMPEVFMAKYRLPARHPAIGFLRILESWSIRRADRVLTPNLAFRDLFVSRGCPENRMSVIMNSPDPGIFGGVNRAPASPSAAEGARFSLMYHGTVVERHGLGTALEAVARVRRTIPGVRFDVYGEGDYVDGFLARRTELGLESVVHYHGFVSLEKIAEAIGAADAGVIPNLRNVFTEINLPTRIFEYLSCGKHVIAPRTRGICDYFDAGSLNFFEPGDAAGLAGAILELHRDRVRADAVLAAGLEVYRRHSWTVQAEYLLKLYRELLGARAGGGEAGHGKRPEM